jgi:hypothetical protein
MEPKVAHGNQFDEVSMNTMATRPTLQQMLKNAMDGASVGSAKIAQEAQRQLDNLDGQSDGAAQPEQAEEKVSGAYARKLASAVEYCVELMKTGADLAGPWNVTENKVEPGKGPGALKVMEAPSGPPPSEDVGQAHAQPPQHPGTKRQLASGKDAPTQMDNDVDHRPGSRAEAGWAPMGDHSKLSMAQLIRKTAADKTVQPTERPAESTATKSASVVQQIRKLAGQAKQAEDAINPAKITAGKAQPPDTLEAGDAGPAGKDKGLVPTTPEGVADFKRRQAKAPMKQEMHQYVDEPMMSESTDKVLAHAFGHTDQAGAKISSAQEVSKVASARALMRQLAENAGVNPVTFK